MLDNRYSKSIHYRPVQSRSRQRLVSWLTVFPVESGGTKKRYIPHLEIYKYIVPALGCMYEYRRACSSIARNAGPGCRCLRIQHMRSCSLDTIIQREIENGACELIYFRNMEGSRWLKKGPCPDSKHPTRYRKITSCTFRNHQQCSLYFPIRPLECWAQLDRRL